MAIDKDVWLKAKALFEIGKSLTDIAEATGIDKSSISKRAKKEGWDKGKNQQLVIDKVNTVNDLEELNSQIQQLPSQIQQEVVNAEISEQLALIKSIQNLDKGALNLHGIILKKTISKAMSGEMSEQEASRVAQSMGLSVDKVAARAGIGKEPQTQVNIQNNNTANAVSDANLEAMVKRVLSSEDDSIINNLEESC